MTLTLSADVRQFIDEKVRSGEYASAEDVIAATIATLKSTDCAGIEDRLTAEDLAELDKAEAEIARGDVLDWATVAAELRKDYLGKK